MLWQTTFCASAIFREFSFSFSWLLNCIRTCSRASLSFCQSVCSSSNCSISVSYLRICSCNVETCSSSSTFLLDNSDRSEVKDMVSLVDSTVLSDLPGLSTNKWTENSPLNTTTWFNSAKVFKTLRKKAFRKHFWINLFSNKPWFLHVCSKILSKTLW